MDAAICKTANEKKKNLSEISSRYSNTSSFLYSRFPFSKPNRLTNMSPLKLSLLLTGLWNTFASPHNSILIIAFYRFDLVL